MSPQRWETSLSYWFMVRTVRACSSGNPCFLPKLDCQSHSCRDNWRASTWWYLLFPSKKSNLAKTCCARKSFLSWNWHHRPRINHYHSGSYPRPTFGPSLKDMIQHAFSKPGYITTSTAHFQSINDVCFSPLQTTPNNCYKSSNQFKFW